MHAKVQAASAAFASTSVSCTLNAAVKAASAVFEYAATPASGAGSSCNYSRLNVPPRSTHILYSSSLRMPLCRIQNPVPYLRTGETLGGGDLVQQRHHVFTTNTPISRKTMLADILASPRPAASFIPFRDSLLGRTSRITPLVLRDTSPPDDDASSDE